ncbi:hypothetical protein ACFL27_01905 [candidate division CSSED10-310 bacterium]|uniref:CARDB domain-containing protein n=1 Tax=candidate division CSSED10-310 bacterium TaxID=2855610 RepID=A0ABV6YS88_UNCC1
MRRIIIIIFIFLSAFLFFTNTLIAAEWTECSECIPPCMFSPFPCCCDLNYDPSKECNPSGDHSDDTFDVSSGRYLSRSFETMEYYDELTSASILYRGFWWNLDNLVLEHKRAACFSDIFTFPSDLSAANNVLIIPTNGLNGLDNSEVFQDLLEEYVGTYGNTVICFTQQHGYEFNLLPGGGVSGYGYREDQSCQLGSIQLSEFHHVLSSVTETKIDAGVDGYFTRWPDNATILIERTKNGMPAMIIYPFGNGWVIATTLYTDWGFNHFQATRSELRLVNDIVTWSKDPVPLDEYYTGQVVSLSVPMVNDGDITASMAEITVFNPDRAVIEELQYPVSLSPGTSTTYVYQTIAAAPHGLWCVEYSLVDAAGNVV